ncbi:MAG: hypothetical protein COC24_010455 [Alphaproteobacteria bacterium]|nr:hypothetical protein [Alphaproteobacteria bacterium]
MTTNFQIVMLFLSDFYLNKSSELVEIISPKFICHSPFFGEVEFDEYVHWMGRLSSQRSLAKITIPASTDDEVFTHEFLLKVLDFSDEFSEEMVGQTEITIRNGLVENVVSVYEDQKLNPEKFARIKAKLLENI